MYTSVEVYRRTGSFVDSFSKVYDAAGKNIAVGTLQLPVSFLRCICILRYFALRYQSTDVSSLGKHVLPVGYLQDITSGIRLAGSSKEMLRHILSCFKLN